MRVQFPAYRLYKENLIAADDALMALMIGARLGEHSLTHSPSKPDALLPELFGEIPGIERLNRTVRDSAKLLASAELHLASMGIPYALSVHGAFMAGAIQILKDDGKDLSSKTWKYRWCPDPNKIALDEVNEYFEERTGIRLPEHLLEIFHLTRKIRNRILHYAGKGGSRLPRDFKQMSGSARKDWQRITERPLLFHPDGTLDLGDRELFATLAFTRGLGHEINDALKQVVSRKHWASVVVDDFQSTSPQKFSNPQQRLRGAFRHSQYYYAALNLSVEELEAVLS
jgi:hypothetical protein